MFHTGKRDLMIVTAESLYETVVRGQKSEYSRKPRVGAGPTYSPNSPNMPTDVRLDARIPLGIPLTSPCKLLVQDPMGTLTASARGPGFGAPILLEQAWIGVRVRDPPWQVASSPGFGTRGPGQASYFRLGSTLLGVGLGWGLAIRGGKGDLARGLLEYALFWVILVDMCEPNGLHFGKARSLPNLEKT